MTLLKTVLIACSVFLSCKPVSKIVKYAEHPNELYTTKSLKDLFHTRDSLNIVLRISELQPEKNAVQKSSNTQRRIVNNIEGQLIKKGFNVKDRTTFGDIISKSYSSDILKRELADADLIFEIIEMNDRVLYSTDSLFLMRNNRSTPENQPITFKSMGGYFECRLILVKTNEIGGIYKFHYQPCPHGCRTDEFIYYGKKDKKVRVPESLSETAFQQFVNTSIEELIRSFKENYTGFLRPAAKNSPIVQTHHLLF